MSSRASRTVYVGNLPGDIREKEVEDLFYKVILRIFLCAWSFGVWVDIVVFLVGFFGDNNLLEHFTTRL